MMNIKWSHKKYFIILLITSIWVHIAEVGRAVFVAFPRMETFFGDRIAIGPMAWNNALIWGLWDMILTGVLVFILWLCINAFGNNRKSILISASLTAVATIGVFWIATVNTGLGEWSTAFIIFPIAWMEMMIAAWIGSKLYKKMK